MNLLEVSALMQDENKCDEYLRKKEYLKHSPIIPIATQLKSGGFSETKLNNTPANMNGTYGRVVH